MTKLNSGTAYADASLDRARLLVVLATIVVNIVTVIGLSFAPWSNWRTGLALNLIDNTILIAFAVAKRDRMMWRLMLFGLLVGITELVADAWIVNVTGSLDYAFGGGPMIWKSPAWMPLAWEVIAVQFGYIGLRLFERWSYAGLVLTGIIGAINIPFYEEMALRTKWWRYHDAAMFPRTHTPWAIILGEFLIAMGLGYIARWIRRPSFARSALAGVIGGAMILVSYMLAFWVLGGLAYS